MRIGNRLFPYPVLNRNSNLSDYTEDCTFELSFDVSEEGNIIIEEDTLVLKNARYKLSSDLLEMLVEEGLAIVSLIIECSYTVYRESFLLESTRQDIRIPVINLSGPVTASCYMYTTENISIQPNEEFLPEYFGMGFDIDKYDILAVDDGFNFRIDMDEETDNKVSSIFSVVQVESDESVLRYESTERNIIIKLPRLYYASYDNIKRHADLNNIAFAMMAIPVLASSMSELQKERHESIDDIIDKKRWFKAVAINYELQKGVPLDIDQFHSESTLTLAQAVLNEATCKGLHDFEEKILLDLNGGEEDDE